MTDETPQGAPREPAATLPGNLTAAVVVLFILGALAGLGTVLMLLAALLSGARHISVYAHPGVMQGPMGGPWVADGGQVAWMGLVFVALLALLGAAVTGGHVAAGWAILQRHSWGRILGMVVSGTALVVLVVGLASMVTWATMRMPRGIRELPGHMVEYDRSEMGATIVLCTFVALLLIAAYGFVLWVLARHGDALD